MRRVVRVRGDKGLVTAEYAVATVAACGFGGILLKVLSSGKVLDLLLKVIEKAFSFAF